MFLHSMPHLCNYMKRLTKEEQIKGNNKDKDFVLKQFCKLSSIVYSALPSSSSSTLLLLSTSNLTSSSFALEQEEKKGRDRKA